MRFEKALEGMRKGKRAQCDDSNGIFYIDEWGDIHEDYPDMGEKDYPATFTSIEIMSETWEFVENE